MGCVDPGFYLFEYEPSRFILARGGGLVFTVSRALTGSRSRTVAENRPRAHALRGPFRWDRHARNNFRGIFGKGGLAICPAPLKVRAESISHESAPLFPFALVPGVVQPGR